MRFFHVESIKNISHFKRTNEQIYVRATAPPVYLDKFFISQNFHLKFIFVIIKVLVISSEVPETFKSSTYITMETEVVCVFLMSKHGHT